MHIDVSSDTKKGEELTPLRPLRDRSLKGIIYVRPAEIEARLRELSVVSFDLLLERCIAQRKDTAYVPSECIMYFMRSCKETGNLIYFEKFYRILIQRVLRSLPDRGYGKGSEQLTESLVRDEVFKRFVQLIAQDYKDYSERLDYYEVRFDDSIACLRCDAQKKVWREANQTISLDAEQKNSLLPEETESAATPHFNPFESTKIDAEDYQSLLDEAIDKLPELQQSVIQMLRVGFLIDSKDPNVLTIAKVLGKSEKTIRLQRDRAFAALAKSLNRGDFL